MATDRSNQDLDANVVADVEYAELGPTIQRKVGEPVSHRRAGPPEVADQDLLVERKDLGPDSSTFIAKGEPIPPELRDLPRRAAREAPSRKR
jgi:hypothetical protein